MFRLKKEVLDLRQADVERHQMMYSLDSVRSGDSGLHRCAVVGVEGAIAFTGRCDFTGAWRLNRDTSLRLELEGLYFKSGSETDGNHVESFLPPRAAATDGSSTPVSSESPRSPFVRLHAWNCAQLLSSWRGDSHRSSAKVLAKVAAVDVGR